MFVMQQNGMTGNVVTLTSERTEDRLKQINRDPRRDSSSEQAGSKPMRAPFLNDGLELVRDSHC
jgi:hypothetical protein